MPHPGEKCLAQSKLFFQCLAEPGPRVLPVPVGHRPRQPERLARLLDGEPSEKVKLSNPRRGSVFLSETGKQLVDHRLPRNQKTEAPGRAFSATIRGANVRRCGLACGV